MITFDRLTSTAELDAILALDDVCFHHPWTRADYERELLDPARCFLYVVRVGGTTVGYCSFWFNDAATPEINSLALPAALPI